MKQKICLICDCTFTPNNPFQKCCGLPCILAFFSTTFIVKTCKVCDDKFATRHNNKKTCTSCMTKAKMPKVKKCKLCDIRVEIKGRNRAYCTKCSAIEGHKRLRLVNAKRVALKKAIVNEHVRGTV